MTKKEKQSKQYLQEVYNFNTSKNAFCIQIAVNHYNEIFNSFDPTPIRIRDLSPGLIEFLDTCSNDIPLNYQVNIEINIGKEKNNPEIEEEIKKGFHHYFQYIIHVEKENIHKARINTLKYALVSFSLITFSILSNNFLKENLLTNILNEGFIIGGWVFLWQAIEFNFIQMGEKRETLNRYNRLSKAKISFIHQ